MTEMLNCRNPHEAYRRVAFDARVQGASPRELVRICNDEVIDAIGAAIAAHHRDDRALKSRAMTRALTALTALQMGIDMTAGMAAALTAFYGAASKAILASSLRFDERELRSVRNDFIDIGNAYES